MDLWTSPADRPEPFGPCGQPMDNVRVAHRLPTLSGLSSTSSTAPTIGIIYNSERNTGGNCVTYVPRIKCYRCTRLHAQLTEPQPHHRPIRHDPFTAILGKQRQRAWCFTVVFEDLDRLAPRQFLRGVDKARDAVSPARPRGACSRQCSNSGALCRPSCGSWLVET